MIRTAKGEGQMTHNQMNHEQETHGQWDHAEGTRTQETQQASHDQVGSVRKHPDQMNRGQTLYGQMGPDSCVNPNPDPGAAGLKGACSPLDLYQLLLERLDRYNYHGIDNVHPCFYLARLYFDCIDLGKTVDACLQHSDSEEVLKQILVARDLAALMAGTIDRLKPLLPELFARRRSEEMDYGSGLNVPETGACRDLESRLKEAFASFGTAGAGEFRDTGSARDSGDAGTHLATHLAASYGEAAAFVKRTDNMLAGKMAVEDYIIEVINGVSRNLDWHLGNCGEPDGERFCAGILTWAAVFLEEKQSSEKIQKYQKS